MTYLSQHPTLATALRRFLEAIATIAAGWLVIRLANGSVQRFLIGRGRRPTYLEEKRARTLASLLRSVFRYVVDFIVLLTILSLFEVPVASVLALSGFIGLAVGFGAQNLVKDIIAGFFILFEDEFTVGEVIQAAGLTGSVEEIGLRTTRLRDFGGQTHTIPNGMVDKITNLSRGEMRALVEVPVPYGADSETVLAAIRDAAEDVRKADAEIKTGPEVLGLTAFGPNAIVYTIQATTPANAQWRVERQLRLAIRRRFHERGIEMTPPAGGSAPNPGPTQSVGPRDAAPESGSDRDRGGRTR